MPATRFHVFSRGLETPPPPPKKVKKCYAFKVIFSSLEAFWAFFFNGYATVGRMSFEIEDKYRTEGAKIKRSRRLSFIFAPEVLYLSEISNDMSPRWRNSIAKWGKWVNQCKWFFYCFMNIEMIEKSRYKSCKYFLNFNKIFFFKNVRFNLAFYRNGTET